MGHLNVITEGNSFVVPPSGPLRSVSAHLQLGVRFVSNGLCSDIFFPFLVKFSVLAVTFNSYTNHFKKIFYVLYLPFRGL